MKIDDLISMSIRSLWRRKLRTFLTVLGVIIGSCSIILMLSIGIAMDEGFKEQMKEMGDLTLIEIRSSRYSSSDDSPKLNDEAIEALMQIPNVTMVIPERSIQAYLQFGKKRTLWNPDIIGLSAEEMDALGYKTEEGRTFETTDKDVIILGKAVLSEFYKIGKEPNWKVANPEIKPILDKDKIEILVGEYHWEDGEPIDTSYEDDKKIDFPDDQEAIVIGLFPEHQYPLGYNIYVPLELFNQLRSAQLEYELDLLGEKDFEDKYGEDPDEEIVYYAANVKVAHQDDVVTVQEQISEMGYRAYSDMEDVEAMQSMSSGIQAFLGGIGAISLFVAAIGITNTMMMATYERTREIGIMKVIGAKINDIQNMFLIEALMIGALGGFCGIIISYIISHILNVVGESGALSIDMMGGGNISSIPIWLAGASLLFSTLIGLVSGYFPARRAMKLSALSAIKTE
ncbi:hypothetical protein AN641_05865 [Candidatus Epulonipiscioides gigas]|nr:hypothetical protein AN641_05865 [Epulopiscium sp. SCG-C07WGA-EpuloA2]